MTPYKRLAIFFAPESQSALAHFGAEWLGWDVETGIKAKHPTINGLPMAIPNLIAAAQKYGFHGTLKAPFRLTEGVSLTALSNAIEHYTTQKTPFTIGRMAVACLGSFVAIIPEEPSKQLAVFSEDIVKKFDSFRAPLTTVDIAKRRTANLTPRQDELMLTWGYPYIFEEFKFHLTLTDKLTISDAESVKEVLTRHLKDILADPVDVVDLCLYGEREDGFFEIIKRFPLLG